MKIEKIRQRVADGKYLIKFHAIRHAIKEGFDRNNIVESIDIIGNKEIYTKHITINY